MPLTPTNGVSTGESLGQRLLTGASYLTSGEKLATAIAPSLRKSKIPGVAGLTNAIGDAYAAAPAPVRFLADNLLSPVGLASTIFAPVTGGASLGATGALGTAARLSVRLGGEAAVAGGATLLAKGAESLVPEDAPWWVHAGVPTLAGLAGGAGVAGAVKGVVKAATPAVVRAGVVDLSKAQGLDYAILPPKYNDLVSAVGSDRNWVGQALARLGLNPSATVAEGSLDQKYLGLVRGQEANTSQVAAVIANTFQRGASAFERDANGMVHNVGTKPITMDTILSTKDAPKVLNLNPEQAQFWETTHKFAGEGGDIDKMRKLFGLKPRPVADLAEGEIYFHREPLTKGGVRMARPADPVKARLWDTAEAAKAAGAPIDYADPITNMAMQYKSTLDEILEAQFERDVFASGITAPKAVLATESGRATHGDLKKAAATVKNKTAELQDAIANDASTVLDAGEGAVPGDFSALQDSLAAAQTKYEEALREWNKAVDQKTPILPGSLVGKKTDELINMQQYRGIDGRSKPVLLAAEDTAKLAQWFSRVGVKGPTFNGIAGTTQEIGDFMRFASASTDLAAPLVQGLPLLARDPVAWAKMAAQTYTSLFDPNVQANYIKNNYAEIMDMVNKGRVPINSSEVFAALDRGNLAKTVLTAGGRTDKVLNVVNRFERSYDTTLLINRVEHWKSMRNGFTGSDEQLGQVIRNLTGGIDTKGLGVGPTQRGIESMVFFAPKMLRSTMALVGQAARPWTPGGAEASHTLMRMMAAGAGSMALANAAVGMSNGETEEEIQKRIADSLDPTKGRQFLSVKVGDEWYGMGGQFRSAAQLVYRGIVSPDKIAQLSSENPLLHYAAGRVSPIANVGMAAAEYATGEKLDLLPFQTVDSFPDIAKLAGTGSLPFFAQSIIQNNGNAVPAIFEFFGARTSPITPTDALDAAAQQRFQLDYRDLTGREQEIVKAANPEAVANQEKLGGKAQLEYRAIAKKNDQRVNDLLVTQSALVKAGKLDPTDFANNVSDMMHDRFLRNEASRQALGIELVGADSPKRQVMDAYFATFKDAGYTPDGGQVDWNKWDALQSNLQIDIKAEKFGNPERAQQYLDERTKFTPPEEAKWFFDNKKLITDSGFYDQREVAFAQVKPMIQSLGYNLDSAADLDMAVNQAINEGAPNAQQLRRLKNLVGTKNEALHKKVIASTPGLRKALVENGVINQRRQDLAQGIQRA